MRLYTVPTGEITPEEAKTKSLILVNPATIAVAIRQLDVSIRAKEALDEIRFDLYRVNAIGTPAGTSTTPISADARDAAATSTALTALTTEPTSVFVIASYFIQPFGGVLSIPFPFGAEPVAAAGGARIGLRYTTPSGVKPPMAAQFWIEE